MSFYDHPQYIPDELNAASEEEIFHALRVGTEDVCGKQLSFESLAVLLAHSALETGRWKVGLHRWNFGNVKAYPDKLEKDQYFTMFRCGEILNGKQQYFDPPHPQCCFRAFKTREDGIRYHLDFLMNRKRYSKAWQEVLKGNPSAYSHELRVGGYYTANEKLYTATLVRLFGEFAGKKNKLLAYSDAQIENEKKALEPPKAPDLKLKDIPMPTIDIVHDQKENEPDKQPNGGKAGIAIVVAIVAIIGYLLSLFGL